jgi:uracil-DNA glycosylase
MSFDTALKINNGWRDFLKDECAKPYMKSLSKFIVGEISSGLTIFPAQGDVFNALATTDFKDVRVVILGQDPYHGAGQAHGLSFSVRKGVKLPPSLRNIYKEIELEFGMPMPKDGDLTGWAKQGVLLLNATLTVREGNAGSHQKKGWEEFTDAIIREVNDKHSHVVFMLWGAYAQKKGAFIDRTKHLVLESVHPSPLSAHRGFLGCGHFMSANSYLESKGRKAIDWLDLS